MLVNKRCTYCGKRFQAHTTKTKYCSHVCNQKHYKQKIKKERLRELSEKEQKNNLPYIDRLELVKAQEYLSINDCAILLNVSRSSIKRLIEKEELSSFNLLSRVLIPRSDIDFFCKKELNKPKFKNSKLESTTISNKAKHFNRDNYYFMGEIPKYYNISLKSVQRHIKSNNIEKIKKGRYNYVRKSDIKKLFGAPTKSMLNG